MTIKMHNVK